MIRPFASFSLAIALLAGTTVSLRAAGQLRWNADSLSLRLEEVKQLPPPPAGVAELKFSELYQMPVGPRGLELTERVCALSGRRVRVLGFMVRQAKAAPGVALLAPYEIATNEHEYGLADDLPPALISLEVPRYEDLAVPFTPGPLLLTGRLEVGRREEADGRISEIRLRLDEPGAETAAPSAAPFEPASVEPAAAAISEAASSASASLSPAPDRAGGSMPTLPPQS